MSTVQGSVVDTTDSVTKLLDSVNYSVDPNYVPSAFALEFVNFIKLVEGEATENKTPVVHYHMLDTFILGNGLDTINMCHRGIAKAVSLSTQVITPRGNVMLKYLNVGDEVYTRKGTKTTITHKSEVFLKPMYAVLLEDGRSLEVSEDHLNIVLKRMTGLRSKKGFKEYILTTTELLSKGTTYIRNVTEHTPSGYESKWYVPTSSLVEYAPKNIPLDPYTVGCILGDGSIDKTSGFTRIYTHVDDLPHFLSNIQGACADSVRSDSRRESTKRFSLKGIGGIVKNFIGTENVYNKRIPQELLWSSSEHRLALLRGLMDTDGTVHNKSSSYCTVSPGLANDIMWLARSLGFEAKSGKAKGYFRIYIYADICPFFLPRKVARWVPNKKGMVAIRSITPIDLVESQCIAVADESKSFLVGDFFVTHNTTLKEYLILYLAVFGKLEGLGKVVYALYISDSIDNGVKRMRKSLEFRWNNSTFLQIYIPKLVFTDIRWEFINKDNTSLVISGHGAQTGVRGTRENGSRPVLALLDDLVSDKDSKSVTVIAAIEDTVYNAIDYALHPTRRKVIWSGTPFNAKDPLYKAVESGAWNVNVYPVCEVFPCTREEFRGSWEDRFTYDYVLKQYTKALKAGRLAGFNQELMLRIMSEEDRLILDSDIVWYKLNNVLKNRHMFNFYITTDFATSSKDSADYSVLSVWAYNSNSDWLWVDGVVKRQDMDKNIKDLFRLVQMYKPQEVGIEVSGQQGGFIHWIQNMMMEKDTYFNLASESNSGAPGVRPTTNKMVRFNLVVPWFKTKKISYPIELKEDPRVVEHINELSLVSPAGMKSKHDDCLDTISQLASLKPWKPGRDSPVIKDSGLDMWEDDVIDIDDADITSYVV